MGDEILELDCSELIKLIHSGSLNAERVCERFLQQYERQRSLNAVTWIDASNALMRARNVDTARHKGARLPALAGLPVLVKDNIDTVSVPTSAGTPSLKTHFPRCDAPVVERLQQQGVIVMGKSNMHELALGVTSSNPVFGFVANPYNTELISGGSSGGSAAAIAARIVPAALGTDTGGSMRIPAAFCGVVGFRPSIYPRKLYSQRGVVPLTLDLDTVGPMGRSVADVAMLHAAIVGGTPVKHQSLVTARIGVPRLDYWDDLDPEVERVGQAALMRLRDQGAVLVEVDLREVKNSAQQIATTLHSNVIAELEKFLRTQVPAVSLRDLTEQIASRDVRAVVERLQAAGPDSNLSEARGVRRDAIRAAYRAVFLQHGIKAVAFPTVVIPSPPLPAAGDDVNDMIEVNGRIVPKDLVIERNCLPAVILGAPALSLPAGLTGNGLPVGLEFDALPGDDNGLLSLGMAAEAAIGRLPPPQRG